MGISDQEPPAFPSSLIYWSPFQADSTSEETELECCKLSQDRSCGARSSLVESHDVLTIVFMLLGKVQLGREKHMSFVPNLSTTALEPSPVRIHANYVSTSSMQTVHCKTSWMNSGFNAPHLSHDRQLRSRTDNLIADPGDIHSIINFQFLVKVSIEDIQAQLSLIKAIEGIRKIWNVKPE
jgi:hypothetical protein